MKLSLCMIARDEEWCLGRCLDSVRGVVDEIVLVDTGSSDRTMEIAREHGAKVLEQAWADDFSAPRNMAAEHASGDWLLSLDADEVLVPGAGPIVRAACERAGELRHIDLPLVNSTSIHHAPEEVVKVGGISTPVRRLVRAGTRWAHRIHEGPYPDGPAAKIPAFIVHYGYAADSPAIGRKTNRNLEILSEEFAAHPDDVYVAGFLLGEYLARYEREFEAWAKGGLNPDPQLLVEACRVVDTALPHLKADADSVRTIANWGLVGLNLGDGDEVLVAASVGEKVSPGHPDWAYLRGVGHYFHLMQSRGQNRQEHRSEARKAMRDCLRKLKRLDSAVVIAASEEKCITALERINRPPEIEEGA